MAQLLQNILDATINKLLGGLVSSAFEFFDSIMLKWMTCVFFPERYIANADTTILTQASLQNLYTFIYAFACAVIVLKLLFKGFQIYILWRNGDADVSPRDMAVGCVEAVVAMLAFPYLYNLGADVFFYLSEQIMGRLGLAERFSSEVLLLGGVSLLMLLLILVFAIAVLVLWVLMIKQGFELLVMRLGLPIACLGLIDSDMGVFKNYIQVFLKTAFTAVIQVTLMSLAFRVVNSIQPLNLIIGIALLVTAFSTPKLMGQFLVPSQGGGLTSKASAVATVARTAKMLLAAG